MILLNWEKGKNKYTLPFFKVESPLGSLFWQVPIYGLSLNKNGFLWFFTGQCYMLCMLLTFFDSGRWWLIFFWNFFQWVCVFTCVDVIELQHTSFTFATFCGRFLSFFYYFFLHRRLLVILKTNEKGYEIMFYDLQEYVHSESLFNFLLGFICIKVYILFQQKAWVLCL